ncbi:MULTISPECIES: hypothetical protein [Cytobacillus]|uniref:hypothetical protein n=1 Tax=Cytobacillus TaxID=2675230 RepID=UPI00203B26C8|nr:hypothetical protein [Cytobacillus firmus]
MFVRDTAGRSLRGSAPVVEHPSEIKEVLENPEKAIGGMMRRKQAKAVWTRGC